MKFRHKKLLVSGTAVAAAGIFGAGTLMHAVLSVQASAEMMPGIETIVEEGKPFRILELTDSSEKAEIGYFVSGQEPYIKLYTWQYTDAEGTTHTVHFNTLEDGLKQLPEKLRREFASNIKLNDDGSINESASTGIRSVRSVSGNSGDDTPLSYSDYTEKYFLESGDDASAWKKIDFTDIEGNSRTDTVKVNGSYEENSSGTGDYTKETQEYYPIRNDRQDDGISAEKYRENIQNFYFTETDNDADRGAYFLNFAPVDNDKVNKALQKDGGQTELAPEYEYQNGRYGYFENVYADLTTDIVTDIADGKYRFPGENPGTQPEGAVLVQKNEKEAVETQTEDDFSAGTDGSGTSADSGEMDTDLNTDDSADDFSGGDSPSDAADSSDEAVSFENGFDENGDTDLDTGDAAFEEQDSEDMSASGSEDSWQESSDDEFSDTFSKGDTGSDEVQESAGSDGDYVDIAGDNGGEPVTSGSEDVDNSGEEAEESIPVQIGDPATEGTQQDPYVYLAENIDEYPFFRYTKIGDLQYIKSVAIDAAQEDPQTAERHEGDITLENDQYWYYKTVDGTLTRCSLTVITGKQPVAFEDIREIPKNISYSYYYRVSEVYFCCRSTGDNQTDFVYTGWYYPSYPDNEDPYLRVTDGDGQTATYYISDAEFSLTPGTGNYDFVPGGDISHQVQVDHVYYQGGYTNNDWMKKYVFHLTPKEDEEEVDGQFEQFDIEVDTRDASNPLNEIFAEAVVSDGTSTAAHADMKEETPAAGDPDEVTAAEETDDFSSDDTDVSAESTEQISSEDIQEDPEKSEENASEETMDIAGDSEETEITEEQSGEDSDETEISEEETEVAGDTTNTELNTLIGGYDLIYVNGDLSEEAAEAIEAADVPCIINNSNVSKAGLGVLNSYINDSDADGHFVNGNKYFFKNTSQSDQEGNLVNTAFHTNFNSNADSDSYDVSKDARGFEEILKYIESENKYRALGRTSDDSSEDVDDSENLDPLSREISQARAVEYIINYKYKRLQYTKSKVNILEIMPEADCEQLDEDEVPTWIAGHEERIESVVPCCEEKSSAGETAASMTDGDPNTFWHTQYNVNNQYPRQHSESHEAGNYSPYIDVTFKEAEDVNGFVYQGRPYRSNGSQNGVLLQYKVSFYDADGRELYNEEGNTGITTANFQTEQAKKQLCEFKKTVYGVKSMRITFEKTLDTKEGNGQKSLFGSCAELDVLYYGDEDSVEVHPEVKSVTASEFVGHINDIGSEYDMLYIGDKKTGNRSETTGNGEYRYVHVGSGVMIPTTGKDEYRKLLGQLDTDYDQTWTGSNGKRRFAPMSTYSEDGSGYFRGSGNDITEQQYNEMMDFVQSGYPVVLANGLVKNGDVNTSEVDSSSWYYQFIHDALKYDNVATVSELKANKKNIKFYSNLAKPVIDFDEEGGKPAEPPRLNETDENGNTITNSDGDYIKGELKYTFTVKNDSEAAPASTTYDCNLYLDLNFDGNLSEKENQDKYMVVQDENGNVLSQKEYSDGTSHYELKVGKKYTVTRKIPEDYYKIITWKLELVSNRNSYIHTSETGYAKQQNTSGQKQVINVVQLLHTGTSGNPGTWNLANSSGFSYWMSKVPDFQLNLKTVTVNDVNNGNIRDENGNVITMEQLLSTQQMLIIGFADTYQDISNDNGQVDAILDFIRSGKSVIFAHDTTSYVNYDYSKMENQIAIDSYGTGNTVPVYWDEWLQNSWQANNPTWGLSLNTVLRSVTGMDRYGITSDAKTGDTTVSALLKKGKPLSNSSVSFQTLMELAGDIAYKNGDKNSSYAQTQGYTNNLIRGNKLGSYQYTKTTVATKVNDGAITQYPYSMGDRLTVGETHGQYYQLALEQDKDINGQSDGKNDVVVWYCLAPDNNASSIYKGYPNDVRNNYYFYSKGNVIYTGAGHSAVNGDQEIQLFVNAIVAAANVTAVQPEISFVKTLNPAAEPETARYYMTDQSNWTQEEANTLEKDMEFYINVKDYNMVSAELSDEDLSKQQMALEFYIEDENGSEMQVSGNTTRKLTDITSQIGQLTEYGTGNTVGVTGGQFILRQNNAYGFTVPDIEQYLRKQQNSSYKENCKIYVKVSSTVYLYGEPKVSTSWASMDLKQRQLFELD